MRVAIILLAACGTKGNTNPGGPDAGSQRPPDGGDEVTPAGPLAGLPSPPGPHIAQIQALGNDAWLELGTPAADPMWGVARGRSWGGRALVLAPGIRGAFFTGEGRHAFVKPDSHAMDDIFVYDINANAWIAVHPGTDIATFNDRVASGDLHIDQNAQLVDHTDQPIPVHVLIHAWDFLAYDPDRDQFAMFANDGLGRYFLGGEPEMDAGLDTLEAQRAAITMPPMSPWFYDVSTARFQRQRATNSAPLDYTSYSFFQYIASKKQYVLAGRDAVGFYDLASATWITPTISGSSPPGYDHGGCYDAKRERLYLGPGSGSSETGLYVFDIATSTWSKPAVNGSAPAGVGTNIASIFCDSVNDVVLVFHYASRTRYVYDPTTNSWTSSPLPASVLDAVSYASFNAFFDPELNAYFLYAAGDSEEGGRMFAYRYR